VSTARVVYAEEICQISLLPTDSVILDHAVVLG
jgi:hypothetical protein